MPEDDRLVPPAGVCACIVGALCPKGDVGIVTWDDVECADWRKGDDGSVLDREACVVLERVVCVEDMLGLCGFRRMDCGGV
jgi:hypothetical protein